jgi:hypothetical protein
VSVELEGSVGGKAVSAKGEGILEVNHVNRR